MEYSPVSSGTLKILYVARGGSVLALEKTPYIPTFSLSHATQQDNSNMSRLTTSFWRILERREVIATLTVVPATYWCWTDLVVSLGGNQYIASLIVVGAWFGIAVDLNENMVGQPEGGDHHHDHDD
jgi:Co/Zn/Cd efflux system component